MFKSKKSILFVHQLNGNESNSFRLVQDNGQP